MISCAGDGYSIGVDIQMRGRSWNKIRRFARDIFEYTLECGGKTFLAKDELLDRDLFEEMYPRQGEFLAVKKTIDGSGLFESDMYRRLLCADQ